MKVVICTQHGGFGLSIPALKRIADEAPDLFEEMCKVEEYWRERPPESRPYAPDPELTEYARKWVGGKEEFLTSDLFITVAYKGRILQDSRWSDQRDHPILVKVVEEMGQAASGTFATLKVVEIPDGTSYEIQEYDGLEWIAETHQTWN